MPAGEVFVDIYADHGCSYAPSCLACPFDVCRYDRGFAGNRVSKAAGRIDRDRQVLEMRSSGMQVEQIAEACGVSGRTIARILSRRGPSVSDADIVESHESDVSAVNRARENGHRDLMDAMGVKAKEPWPSMAPQRTSRPATQLYSST